MKLESYQMHEALQSGDVDGALRILLKHNNLEQREAEILAAPRKNGLNFAADYAVVIYFKGPSFILWSDSGEFKAESHNPNLLISEAPLRGIRYKLPPAVQRKVGTINEEQRTNNF